ncbi:MAG: hypothetical protein H7203_14950 [Rhizobacter sp.]|nr:hypothetical protein [Burkholderiales bacterium]
MIDKTTEVEAAALTMPAFSSKRFAPAVGQSFVWRAFRPDGSEVTIDMTLVELSIRRGPPRFEQFSMLFTGSADVVLEQGTYSISNSLTGTEALFASCIGPDASGQHQYEVCISRDVEQWEQDEAIRAGA